VKEEAMLTIRSVDPARAVPVFLGIPDDGSLTPAEWDALCKERGLLALAAERDGELVGFAIAESHPQGVPIFNLEGDSHTCRLLLDRLTRLAGERNVSAWVPIDRPDVRRMVERRGFVRLAKGGPEGRPSDFDHWNRNADV
jgi:hypothetical protein